MDDSLWQPEIVRVRQGGVEIGLAGWWYLEPLYRWRKSTLGALSTRAGNVHPVGCEKPVAESVYLLQQPAYDCRLASLSGKQLKASSHPPCPVSRNLKCQWAMVKKQPEC